LSVLFSCDDKMIDPYVCEAPSLVSADQTCNAGNGLLLTATTSNVSLDLEWTIIALKDSAAKGWTGTDLTVVKTTSGKTYTVPDSIVKNYRTLMVSTATKCVDGSLLHSINYRFIQTRSATSNCLVWTFNNPD
jgi:hypothetical protein